MTGRVFLQLKIALTWGCSSINYPGCVKLLIIRHPKVKRVEVQGDKFNIYSLVCAHHPIVEICPSCRKSRSPERKAGQIFDRKLLNSRFCACGVKMCLKVSGHLPYHQNFVPLIGNHNRGNSWYGMF